MVMLSANWAVGMTVPVIVIYQEITTVIAARVVERTRWAGWW
jgi:hypothetical protein